MRSVRLNKILFIIAMIACYTIIFIDESGVAVTLPTMQKALSLSSNDLHWVVNIYLLSLSVLLLLGGKLSDIYGTRRIFSIGTTMFIAASIICASAQNDYMILIGRFIQGIGASFLMPCILVLVQREFSDSEFGKAFGLILAFANVFYAAGPFVAGVLTEYASWRWFFWLNIPVGVICLTFVRLVASKDTLNKNARFTDIKGLVTFVITLSALVLAVMQGAEWGWTSAWIIALFVIAAAGLVFFIRTELMVKEPLLDVRLFLIPTFAACSITLFSAIAALSVMVFWALWLQTSVGFSPSEAGVALLPASFAFIFMTRVSGAWRDKSGPRAPILLGGLLILFGLLWVALTLSKIDYAWMVFGLVAFGFGLPLVIPPCAMTIVSSVTAEKRGMASGTSNTIRQFSLSVGIALLSAIVASYQHHLVRSNLSSKVIYTHAVVYGMVPMIVLAFIACVVSFMFIKNP